MSSVSFRNKIPNWVSEKLTLEGLEGPHGRSSFAVDPDVPAKFRSTNDDFWDSGYSRGHLAASANHKDSEVGSVVCIFTFIANHLTLQNVNMSFGFTPAQPLALHFPS